MTAGALPAKERLVTSATPQPTQRRPSRTRAALHFLWTGPLVGALFFVGLFGLCLARFGSGEYMGVENDEVIDRVTQQFMDPLIRLQLQLLTLYMAIGAAAGLLATLHWRVVAAVRGISVYRGWRLALRVLGVVAAYHVWFLGRTLIVYPQVLVDAFYAAGGFWRWIQVTLCDHVPPEAFDAIAWAYLTVVVGAAIIASHQGVTRRMRLFVRSSRWLYPTVGLAGAAIAAGLTMWLCRPEPPAPAQNNVLIIAVDSLRHDRITEEGDRPLPNLAALERESINFTNAWTVMPRTFPSWVSMLTGQYPHEHGVRHMFPAPELLGRERATLISKLRAAGYRTAVISDFAGDIFSRIELGFDEVRVPRFTLWSNVELGGWKLHYHLMPYVLSVLGGQRTYPILKLWERLADPDALTGEAIRWLRKRDERPFCLVIFYSAPHFPYAVPYPDYAAYTDPGYEGPSRFHKASWVDDTRSPGPAEQEQVVALYDGALRATDRALGRLLGELRRSGLMERTHILVTADHGENLYERGFGIGHGDHLRGSAALRIPLLLRPASKHPVRRVVSAPVRSIDIGPTLLDLVGQPPLTGPVSGTTLLPLADTGGSAPVSERPVFFETGLWFINPEAEVLEGRTMTFVDGFGAYKTTEDTHEIYFSQSYEDDFLVAKHRAVLADGYKLIYIPTRQGVVWELFDVNNDADETHNLVHERPQIADRLRRQLYEWMLSDPEMVQQGEYVVPRAPR